VSEEDFDFFEEFGDVGSGPEEHLSPEELERQREAMLSEVDKWLEAHGVRVLSKEEGRFAAECLLSVPREERKEKAVALFGDDPHVILTVFELLRGRWESDPATVRDEAEYFYRFLESVPPRKKGQVKTGKFKLDEREYFLGEAALIAGTACRLLSRRDEARRWFGLAEGWFLIDENNVGDLSRLNYQKLALLLEERRFDEVLERLPAVLAGCEQAHLAQESLKCRIIEGNIFREQGRLAEAAAVFREVCRQGRITRSDRVVASGYVNLAQIHGELNEPAEAIEASRAAMPLLKKLGNRIAWAKVQCGLGILYRSQKNRGAAVEAFHLAQKEFEELGMRADVAGLHLMIADLLLDYGLDREAKREVEVALPIIDEYKLIPEGVAALTLLRQSVKSSRVDRHALQELNGLFPAA
jgi:tetratricopeptide (TPR) repeat protein